MQGQEDSHGSVIEEENTTSSLPPVSPPHASLRDLLRGDVLESYSPASVQVVDTRASFMSKFNGVSTEEQLSIINDTLRLYAKRVYELDVPPDLISLSLRGMKHLEKAGRINIIQELVKAWA